MRALWGGLMVLCCALWAPVHAEPLELRQAQALIVVNGQASNAAVNLPCAWDRHHKGQWGEAVFDLGFDLPHLPQEPWAIDFPRVGTAFSRLLKYLTGKSP